MGLSMKIKKFEDIQAWQEARILVKMVYDTINASQEFRKDFKMASQISSAAVSVMSNIAEGFSRRGVKEFMKFLYISKASASEVQSILYAAMDQGYLNDVVFKKIYGQADKVSQIDSGFIKYLSTQ